MAKLCVYKNKHKTVSNNVGMVAVVGERWSDVRKKTNEKRKCSSIKTTSKLARWDNLHSKAAYTL